MGAILFRFIRRSAISYATLLGGGLLKEEVSQPSGNCCMWGVSILLKVKIVVWHLLKERLSNWEWLQMIQEKENVCLLCEEPTKDVVHLFFYCQQVFALW